MLNDTKLLVLRTMTLVFSLLTLFSQLMFILAGTVSIMFNQSEEVIQIGFILAQAVLMMLNLLVIDSTR
jgi:hypothetical protein